MTIYTLYAIPVGIVLLAYIGHIERGIRRKAERSGKD